MTATIHPIGLSRARNMHGKLGPDVLARLQRVLKSPSDKTWNDAHSIIVGPQGPYGITGTTLWQAVIAADPTFPKVGPSSNARGKRLEKWARVPTRDLLIAAINLVTMEPVRHKQSWGCCRCASPNGLQRSECRTCGQARSEP